MRASLPQLIQALHAQKPPSRIWQKPFDYDPSHYKRLCRLKGEMPTNRDLIEYSHDLLYEPSPLQPDLFRYLLPICLDVWRKDLLSHNQSEYGGFVEYFWAALANKPLLQDNLNSREYAAVESFMAASLLDCIDQQNQLVFSGMGASPYTWFYTLSSFCVVFPTLSTFWTSWWEISTSGQACSVLQYLSCLLYENDRNPVFTPWTPNGGGGPPELWGMEGHIYERGWRTENVDFLQQTLTPEYVKNRLQYAAETVKEVMDSPVPQQMLEEFAAQRTLLESRLEELPSLLLSTRMASLDWSR